MKEALQPNSIESEKNLTSDAGAIINHNDKDSNVDDYDLPPPDYTEEEEYELQQLSSQGKGLSNIQNNTNNDSSIVSHMMEEDGATSTNKINNNLVTNNSNSGAQVANTNSFTSGLLCCGTPFTTQLAQTSKKCCECCCTYTGKAFKYGIPLSPLAGGGYGAYWAASSKACAGASCPASFCTGPCCVGTALICVSMMCCCYLTTAECCEWWGPKTYGGGGSGMSEHESNLLSYM